MTLHSDLFLDRRRLKRSLTLWRTLGIVALAGFVIAVAARFDLAGTTDHVARLSVSGIIVEDRSRLEALDKIADDPKVRALILEINSPGGSFVGGESLYEKLREVAKEKPVIAVMSGTAASAGYLIAVAADRIVARKGTVTGSIGVILQSANVNELLERLGIKPEILKSGPFKAQPNPFEPFSEEARAATRAVLDDLYVWFVDTVAERRGLDRDKVLKLADGRIFTGSQAKDSGLVDQLGAEAEARAWLKETHDIPEELPLFEVEIPREDGLWRNMLSALFGKALFSERLKLDGVISLWHPAL